MIRSPFNSNSPLTQTVCYFHWFRLISSLTLDNSKLEISHTRANFRPCSHGYDIVPFHFGPFQNVVRRGVAFTRVRKKSSGPFQNRSRNWAVRKSEPEIGTIRYRTVPLSCEQKRYDIVPLSGPVWYLQVTPSWFL